MQLTSEVPYQVADTPEGFRVIVMGAKLQLRNHGRALDTSFFDTPIKRVELKQNKTEVWVDVHTQGKPAHSEKLEEHTGRKFLFVDVQPPAAASQAAATEPVPAATKK